MMLLISVIDKHPILKHVYLVGQVHKTDIVGSQDYRHFFLVNQLAEYLDYLEPGIRVELRRRFSANDVGRM